LLAEADKWIAEADKMLQGTKPSLGDRPQWFSPFDRDTTRLLRNEAEAVAFYDPIFPSEPFAH
jgi:hypothetical protein